MPPGAPPFNVPLPPKPMGNTAPAAQQTVNLGQRAAGLARLKVVCKVLEEVIPMLGSETDEGQAALKMLQTGSKFSQPVEEQLMGNEIDMMRAQAPAVPSPNIPMQPQGMV